jgi:glycosyltransferase involved in cell wall biosynthesis
LVLSIVTQKTSPPIEGMWTRQGSSARDQRRPEVLARMSAVSVTATVLNEVDEVDRLLTSLMKQTLRPEEVVIVDGGSTDGTWERLRAASSKYPNLLAIQDPSCNLKGSTGPIARGRNLAISKSSSDVIACVDAGCTYDSEWLDRLTAPILKGSAQYAVGGSCIDPEDRTIWDIASAPFFGIKLDGDEPTKSCTARSMAFRKQLWQQVGGFPEDVFLGEDTVFDMQARKTVTPAFAERAKAHYRPRHTFQSAIRQIASYAKTDGVLGARRARLFRNLARCLAEVVGLALIPVTVIPLLCVLALEIYFAFRLDWRSFPGKFSPKLLGARFLFSLVVPWVVTWNQIAGMLTKTNQPNRQNVG